MRILFAILILCFACGGKSFKFSRDQRKRKCEKVTSSTCLNRVHQAYNSTAFPNLLQHKTQEEAIFELKHYDPLINYGCSKHLATFLCTLYIPICTEHLQERIVPPCKSLCVHAMNGCSPIMKEYNVKWRFNCDDYPDSESDMCVGRGIDKDNTVKINKEKKNKNRKGWISASENKMLKLQCPYGKSIYIRKVRHGDKSKCCPRATKAVLTAICNGKLNCEIKNAQEMLGGHCNDSIGKLSVRYKCIYGLDKVVQTCHINSKN